MPDNKDARGPSGTADDSDSTESPDESPTPSELEKQDLLDEQHLQDALKPYAEPAEYSFASSTKFLHLGTWFTLNLILTFYNKALLREFSFPWLLTALHCTCVTLGCLTLNLCSVFTVTRLTWTENSILWAFSLLFTLNIAMSNVSLAIVSVPFHQIMRATCPVITMVIYWLFFGRSYSKSTYIATVPVVLGVGLATYGDYYFTITGLALTLLGVLLSSIKTVMSNKLMTGRLSLPAMEILLRMSPLAAAQAVMYAAGTGELSAFVGYLSQGHLSRGMAVALLGNGAIAFFLNLSSFQTNKVAGALTLTVAGNLKQCLTIALSIVLFHVQVGPLNGLGMVISLLGAAWYSKSELSAKRNNRRGPSEK